MADELRDLHRSELHRGERLGFQGVEHQTSPLGTADQRGKQSGAVGTGRLWEGGVKELTDGSITARSQRTGGGDGDGFVRTSEGLGEGRANLRIRITQQHEHASGGDLRFDRDLGIAEKRQQAIRNRGKFGLQATIGEPERGDRGGGAGDG